MTQHVSREYVEDLVEPQYNLKPPNGGWPGTVHRIKFVCNMMVVARVPHRPPPTPRTHGILVIIIIVFFVFFARKCVCFL